MHPVDPQSLNWTGSRRPQHLLPLHVAGLGVVPERLVPVHPEHVRREDGTLRRPLAAREVNGESQDAYPWIRLDQGRRRAPDAFEPFPGATTPTLRVADGDTGTYSMLVEITSMIKVCAGTSAARQAIAPQVSRPRAGSRRLRPADRTPQRSAHRRRRRAGVRAAGGRGTRRMGPRPAWWWPGRAAACLPDRGHRRVA